LYGDDAAAVAEEDAAIEREAAEAAAAAAELPQIAPRITPGTARLRRVIGDVATEDDLDAQLEDDTNVLVWNPVLPADELRTQIALGDAPDERDVCFGCASGGVTVGGHHMIEMAALFREAYAWTRPEDAANQVWHHYEHVVRAEHNRALTTSQLQREQGVLPLGPWNPASILEHFTKHSVDFATFQAINIRRLSVLADEIYTNGLYFQNSRNLSDRRVKEKGHRLYTSTLKQAMDMYKCVPASMAIFSTTRGSVDARPRPAMNNRPTAATGTERGQTMLLTHYFGENAAEAPA
jgi:hypothetical protein